MKISRKKEEKKVLGHSQVSKLIHKHMKVLSHTL